MSANFILALFLPAVMVRDASRWVHEVKFDGYRMAARIDRGKVQLLTRSGLDWTEK
jgi:ATP-dependent DNA ligase